MSALLAAALALLPASPPVVAVLYFDNNTGLAELDVLCKGFTDMMVTDLASAEGVRVVEREKLQALLDELKLQQQSYFDPATAVKLGKGLGATYAVTGSFLTMDPQLRVDIRLIEIATATVVIGESVVGERARLFELQQTLVKRFVDALKVKLAPAVMPRTKADYSAVLAYSHALEQVDRGQLEGARSSMQQVVKKSPAFVLARVRLGDIERLLKEANQRRGTAQEDALTQLKRNARAFITSHSADKDPEAAVCTLLGYRYVEVMAPLWELKKLMTPGHPALVMEGKEAEAQVLMDAYAEGLRAYILDRTIFTLRFLMQHDPWVRLVYESFKLPDDDQKLMDAAKLGRPPQHWEAERLLAEFLLLGKSKTEEAVSFTVWPPPAVRHKKDEAEGLALAQSLISRLDETCAVQPAAQFSALMARDVIAQFYVVTGRVEDALGVWQDFLERYPTSSQFEQAERRIKEHAGLSFNHAIKSLTGYAPAVAACEDMPIRVGLDKVIERRMFTMGWDAIPFTVRELEGPCATSKRGTLEYVYAHAASLGAQRRNCRVFTTYTAEFLRAGGSRRDAEARWKNSAPQCAAPLMPDVKGP